jgi:Family of unknown function (DUF6065)
VIKFYTCEINPLPLVPGRKNREWFDLAEQKFYQEVEFASANEAGWELRCPCDFILEWHGNSDPEGLIIHHRQEDAAYFESSIGHGVCSIRTGYIVVPPEDHSLLLTGVPNYFKDGIHVMTSLIEREWSYVPYYINLKMTRKGKIEFRAGDPLAFITIVPQRSMEKFEYKMDSVMNDRELLEKYTHWLNGGKLYETKDQLTFIEKENIIGE